MQIVQIIPITKSITNELLTYFSAKEISTGTLVTAPLRSSTVTGIVVSADTVTNMKLQLRGANYQIRNITEIHENSIYSAALLDTCNTLKSFYATSTGQILQQISPTIINKNIQEFTRPKNSQEPGTFIQKILQQPSADRISLYKTMLREHFFRKESLHIICPTQQSVERLFTELSKNNPDRIFFFHGKSTKKQILDRFQEIQKSEQISCVISTGGFIDTYQNNKKTLVIHDHSSEYYRSVSRPYIDYRSVSRIYAEQAGLAYICSDSISSLVLWQEHLQGRAEIIEPYTKNIFKKNSIEIIKQHQRNPGKQSDQDRFKEIIQDKSFKPLHKKTRTLLKKSIDQKERIFISTQKKSLAPNIVCSDCGHVASSEKSGLPYSLYIQKGERIFLCQHSGEKIPAYDICPQCDSWKLTPLGIGTETLREYIHKEFPEVEIHIIDSTHAKTITATKKILQRWNENHGAIIIIGTQKAIPLLDTIDRSIIVSLDGEFARMDHGINQHVLKRIVDIKEKTKNPLVIQSRNVLEELLPIINDGLYLPHIKKELSMAKEFNYPPFSRLIKVVRQVPKTYAKKEYQNTFQLFQKFDPSIMLQPASKKNLVRIITLIHLPKKQWSTRYQDPELLQILSNLDRSTEVIIDPSKLN